MIISFIMSLLIFSPPLSLSLCLTHSTANNAVYNQSEDILETPKTDELWLFLMMIARETNSIKKKYSKISEEFNDLIEAIQNDEEVD